MGSETNNATEHGWLSRRYEFEEEDPEWEQVGHFPTPNTGMRRKGADYGNQPRQFYKENKASVPLLLGTVEELRAMMSKAKMKGQSEVELIRNGLTVEDHIVSSDDGVAFTVRTYTPSSDHADFPAMLYFHGGGWALGDLDGEDSTCRALCVQTGVVLANVEYRLAPEHPHPAAVNDAWTALEWMIKNAVNLRIDPNKILAGGTSAGGNLAAVLCIMAKERGIQIQGQLLRIPALCASDSHSKSMDLKSMSELHDAAILPPSSVRQFLGWYGAADPTDITVSPLLAQELTDLPRAYFQVCGRDPLRDEGLAYADRLEESGVPVWVNVYPGLPHGFWIFPTVSTSKVAENDLVNGVKWLLEEK